MRGLSFASGVASGNFAGSIATLWRTHLNTFGPKGGSDPLFRLARNLDCGVRFAATIK